MRKDAVPGGVVPHAVTGPCAEVVHGENLAALRALADDPARQGSFRLLYCDPPYNTGRRFEHYDDAMPEATWRDDLLARLEAARPLLTHDAVVAFQIAGGALGVSQLLLDEAFGAEARLGLAVVKMSELSGVKMAHAHRRLPRTAEFIFFYGASDASRLRMIRKRKPPDVLRSYLQYYTRIIENPDDPVESWVLRNVREAAQEAGVNPTDPEALDAFRLREAHRVVYRTNHRHLARLRFPGPLASVEMPDGTHRIWWEGRQMLFLADHVDEWLGDVWTEFSTINLHREGAVPFPNGKKPEALLRRIIELTTEPGDRVLDPWSGSGTVPATALKLGRHALAIEAGPQATTHILPRLARVVAGKDPSGITDAVGWTGGGEVRRVELRVR